LIKPNPEGCRKNGFDGRMIIVGGQSRGIRLEDEKSLLRDR
jgi:hypothetical protein